MKVTKKKGYYYLRFSYKSEGKVKTRDKYLGKTIPPNINEIKQEFWSETQGKELFDKFDRIKENYQKEWKKFPESIKDEIRKEVTVRFTYNTNAIEGSTITLEETKELIERKIAPNNQMGDVYETKSHATLFMNMLESKYSELSLGLVIGWHKSLFQDSKPDIAGKIRDYLVRVKDHVFPDWQDLPKSLDEFFKWYSQNKNSMHPVELAAKSHFKFVKIHPFGDGNGRISRLIMNFILHKNGYPLMIIEYRKRGAYYSSLSRCDKEGSDWCFMMHFYRRYLKDYARYL